MNKIWGDPGPHSDTSQKTGRSTEENIRLVDIRFREFTE